ncbi:MAG TPA: M1 family metallopeptidase [Longimicrobiales bacterium]|nr:M1 family metallopeptidase [Longimicrobiales bacterium]
MGSVEARERSAWVGAVMVAAVAAALLPGGAVRAQGTSAVAGPGSGGPVPAPVVTPAYFDAAVRRGSRTTTGKPGPSYWTNGVSYDLRARIDPATARLGGQADILYVNRSPLPLRLLVLHLYQNLHKQGAPRNSPQEVTGGIELSKVSVGGVVLEAGDLRAGAGYSVEGTVMTVRLLEPLAPGDTAALSFAWTTTLPQNGSGRMGHSNHEMYFVAYWFPKMAVFDDLRGWDAEPYLSNAEFYDSFGSYRATLSVPAGWTVMATGRLVNGEEVYTPATLARLEQAASSDDKVEVATEADLRTGRVTLPGVDGWLTYRFEADSVRDFAWTTSNVQRWDATSAVVPDRNGDGTDDRVLIHSFWRESRAPLWEGQWLQAKQSIEHHSRFTGLSYPWLHMTSVEGADIIGGGMEFPMLTLIGPYEGAEPQALFSVTSHELGHNWIPMIVGANETRNAWIDEGSTTFLEGVSKMALWPGVDHHRIDAQAYFEVAAAGLEQPLMRHGDWYEPGPGYGIASYSKPATLMVALRDIMGWAKWEEAYRTFIAEWAYKHPTPWDFFNTFERFAGEDLDWFWTSFYYETWTVDFDAVSALATTGSGTVVRVANRGFAPFPVKVRITTSAGGVIDHDVPVSHWLEGKRWVEIPVPASAGSVTRVDVDPLARAPDVDRTNNFWPRG